MKKSYLFLLLAAACLSGKVSAQSRCGTDEMRQEYKRQHPEIAINEAKFRENVANFLAQANKKGGGIGAKTTGDVHNDTDYYDIPVVIHVMHTYGNDVLPDNDIYKLIDNLNKFYNAQNDLSAVVPEFRKYIGKAKFRFHLATIDPYGNRTKGITHRYTYLSLGGDDQAKMDLWPPQSYYNIWFENYIGKAIAGGTVLAYATFPTASASNPYYDGVISGYQYINDATHTIEHESGHYFSLEHTWNSSNAGAGEACGDDEVDDTPPTKGHFSTCNLVDTECATNYFKIYTSVSGTDSLENYPDTANTQNVMDYSSCTNMLTQGQVWRMRAALNSTIANRNNLWDTANLTMTGALLPYPDLAPVPDFVPKISNASTTVSYFAFPGVDLFFASKSWGDTVTKVAWTFDHSANPATFTQSTPTTVTQVFPVKFGDPGWATVKMDVDGNNTGTSTKTFSNSIYVAESTATAVDGYAQAFDPTGDRDKWPTFNYFNNEFHWELNDQVGMYDHSCMMYKGYDDRIIPFVNSYPLTGTPKGDYDDFFTRPFDFSAYASGKCNLIFNYASASRTSTSTETNDTLVIEYSANKSISWFPVAVIAKGALIHNGTYFLPFAPSFLSDWGAKTIPLPAGALKPYTVFRFRYKPGASTTDNLHSTGNNFYIDNIRFSQYSAEVSNVRFDNSNVAIVPNPTQGDAYVVIKDGSNVTANVVVTDIAGKTVYTTSQPVIGQTRIAIPHEVIATKGVYLVQTSAGGEVNTQKLVVY